MRFYRLFLLVLAGFWLGLAPAGAAGLLPNGKQQIVDANGDPCVGCKLYFYIPNTTTPKDTWTDAEQTTLNTNPVVLDAMGTAVIYGSGVYRQILKDADGVTLWDQPTADPVSLNASWGGLSGGSANAQTLTVGNYSQTDGQVVSFIAGFSNSGPMTLNVNSLGAVAVVKDTSNGPIALSGGEVIANNAISVVYSETTGQFHLLTPTPTLSFDSAVFFNGILTPTILASDQDDYTPPGNYSGANTLRISANTAIKITGLTGGAAGRFLAVQNIGSGAITFTSGSTASAAANRFAFPSSVTLRTNDAVLLFYDSATASWRISTPLISQAPGSLFKNLRVTNGVTANNQILGTADAFTLTSSIGHSITRTSLSCTADVTLSGAGGLDVNLVAAITFYSYWFIYNPATNTDSCLLSTSATAPTLPLGYTFAGRAGWNKTDSSSHFYRVLQYGNRAHYVVTAATNTASLLPILTGIQGTYSASGAPAWQAATVSASVASSAAVVPTTASDIILVAVQRYNGAAASNTQVAPNSSYSSQGTTNPPYLQMEATIGSASFVMPLEGATIQFTSNAAGGGILAAGWYDNL